MPQPPRSPEPRRIRAARSVPWTLLPALVLALLLSACGGSATVPAGPSPDAPIEPTPTVAVWSDPGAWPSGRVPAAGEDVVVPADAALLLDVSPPRLGALEIDGALVFDRTDLALEAERIRVRGRLEIGTPRESFEQRARIVLHGPDDGSVDAGLRRGLVIAGGTVVVAGAERLAWARLGATLEAGSSTLELERAPDWRPGDRIVVASTDFDWRQTETFTVARVDGTSVELADPAAWTHWGELQRVGGRDLDERAEVGLLSRTVTIAGADDELWREQGFGAHVMVHHDGMLHLSGVEITRAGQRGRLGRYPVHWHLTDDRSAGSYLRDASVHGSANRCVTIHGSDGVTLERVVAHDALGHCFFLEDGAETGNALRENLALAVERPDEGDALLASDREFLGPAAFWITHPDNEIVGNVAAGGDGSGFWIALPEHPTGPSFDPEVWPRRTPLGVFRGNVAHSMGSDGLHVDRGPTADLSGTETTVYAPREDPADAESAPVTARFEDVTAWKNRGRGIWLRGRHHEVAGAVLADNAIGATFASSSTTMRDALVVAESANLGTPEGWGWRGEGGRSLPRPWRCSDAPCADATFALRGFEFYDGTVRVEDSVFVGFAPATVRSPDGSQSAERDAGALSQLDYTDFTVSPENAARGLSFEGSVPVHFERRPVPTDAGSGEDGYRSTVFVDEDGSVSGEPGAMIVVDNPFLLEPGCSERPTWGAWVCPGVRYGQLMLDDVGGAGLAPLRVERGDGAEHTMLGMPGGYTIFSTSAPLERSYRYDPGAPFGDRVRLHLRHVGAGDSVTVALPWPGGALWTYRDWWISDRNELTRYDTLTELENAPDAGYHLADGVATLRLVVQDGRDWATVDVCAVQRCGQ